MVGIAFALGFVILNGGLAVGNIFRIRNGDSESSTLWALAFNAFACGTCGVWLFVELLELQAKLTGVMQW